MKETLKHRIERHEQFFQFIETCYYGLQYRRFKEYLFGTKTREDEWATRHLNKREKQRDDWGTGAADWIEGYWASRTHPHRPRLVEAISQFNPASVLEVGCNCGPNLFLLSKQLPNSNIAGTDINPVAIQEGRDLLAKAGVTNVSLSVGKADELKQFGDDSFDVVFTDAVLLYIGPDKIEQLIRELLRVTRRALILLEWHTFTQDTRDAKGLGTRQYDLWKRDYQVLLAHFNEAKRVEIHKLPDGLWDDPGWRRYGAIIEILVRLPS